MDGILCLGSANNLYWLKALVCIPVCVMCTHMCETLCKYCEIMAFYGWDMHGIHQKCWRSFNVSPALAYFALLQQQLDVGPQLK